MPERIATESLLTADDRDFLIRLFSALVALTAPVPVSASFEDYPRTITRMVNGEGGSSTSRFEPPLPDADSLHHPQST